MLNREDGQLSPKMAFDAVEMKILKSYAQNTSLIQIAVSMQFSQANLARQKRHLAPQKKSLVLDSILA